MEQIKKDSERDYGESEYDEFYNIKGDIQVCLESGFTEVIYYVKEVLAILEHPKKIEILDFEKYDHTKHKAYLLSVLKSLEHMQLEIKKSGAMPNGN